MQNNQYQYFPPNAAFTVLVAHDGCLYHGIHINDGDVFQPVRIIEDYLSQFEDVREECVECECEVSYISLF